MHAFTIIEAFNPIDHIELGLRARFVAKLMDALDLQGLEEASYVQNPSSRDSVSCPYCDLDIRMVMYSTSLDNCWTRLKRLRYWGMARKKNYLHVEDCVNALMHVCEQWQSDKNVMKFQVYNLGFPAYCTVRDSARWICHEMGLTPEFEFGGGPKGWVGDNPFVFLDVRKAIKTGWQPNHSIEFSVRATVDWLKNKWIFKPEPR